MSDCPRCGKKAVGQIHTCEAKPDTPQRGAERLAPEVLGACEYATAGDRDEAAKIIAADPGIRIMFDRETIAGAVAKGWLTTNRKWDSDLAFVIIDAIMELLARKWEQGNG